MVLDRCTDSVTRLHIYSRSLEKSAVFEGNYRAYGGFPLYANRHRFGLAWSESYWLRDLPIALELHGPQGLSCTVRERKLDLRRASQVEANSEGRRNDQNAAEDVPRLHGGSNAAVQRPHAAV